MRCITRSRYFRYHIKPMLKNILIISSILIIMLLLSILIINNIKDQFWACDLETGHTCTIYELHRR